MQPGTGYDATLGELAAFVLLCRRGSFTQAAHDLHLSQPGLSARIARLERTLGQRLVDRTVRPSLPTPAGRAFLPFAEEIVRSMLEGRQAVQDSRVRRPAHRPAATASHAAGRAG